jgi:hypothetical protein
VSFLCTVGNRALSAPNGWQTRQVAFYFSRGDLDARGRTVQYMYRRKATDGTLLVSVDCTVPYTEPALRQVDRWLGVEADGSVAQFKAREEMVNVQGCVGDGVCTLDPLVVTPPPTDPCSNCEPPPPPRPSGGTGGTGGDGWGGGGDTGGDGGSDSGAPYIGTDEETEGSCPQCGEKDALVKQQETINEAIGKVRCESMQAVLRERLPYMKVFTEQPAHLQGPGRKDLGYHADGVIYVYEGLWKNDAEGNPTIVRDWDQLVKVLVHEAAHAYWSYYQGYWDRSGTHHDRWDATMAECGYPVGT